MAEIDSLEIQISADSQRASQSILALAGSLKQLSSVKMDGVENLSKAVQPLRELGSTLSSLGNKRVSDNMINGVVKLVGAFNALTQISGDISGIKKLVESINALKVNPEIVSNLKGIASAFKGITNAKANENAADSLRLFIDTVRVINDDDIQRLEKLTEAANALKGVKLQNLSIRTGEEEIEQNEDTESSARAERRARNFDKIREAIEKATEKAREFNRVINKIGTALFLKSIFSPITKIASGFGKAITKANEFLSSIKRIAMYRAIRSVIKAITEGFAQGRENLYYYSQIVGTDFAKSMDMAATSFLYLKNSIGAATAPLTNYLVPILDKVIDRVVDLINKFNELTAVLTGASTWTRALKYPTTWKDSLDDANKSAKKLKTTMLGFDELNVIEPPTTGKSGSGFAEDDYLHMFEEVEVDAKIVGLTFDSGIFEPIASAWNNSGADMFDRIVTAWQNIRDLVGAVGRDFSEIWQNGTGQKSLEIIIEIVGNIARAFGNLASSIQIAWDNAGAGKKVIQSIWSIANNLGTIFSRTWKSIADWAATVDFSPVIESLGTLFSAIERITDPDGALARMFGKVWEKVLEPLATWTIEEGLPAAIDMVTLAIEGLTDALELIEPWLDKFTDFISAVGSWTGDNIVGIANSLKALRQINNGEEVSDEVIQSLGKVDSKNSKRFGWWRTWSNAIQEFTAGESDSVPLADFIAWFGSTQTGDIDYEAGQSAHLAAMQAEWNSPTTLSDYYGKDGWASSLNELIASRNDPGRDETTWHGESGYGALKNFAAAWNAGTGGYFYRKAEAAKAEKSAAEGVGTEGLAMAGTVSVDNASNFIDNWLDGFNQIKKSCSDTYREFSDDWGSGVDTLKTGASNFGSAWSDGIDTIGKKFSEFGAAWRDGWESIKRGASEKWSAFKDDWSGGVESIKNKWDGFKSAWSDGWNEIHLYAQKMVGKVVSAARVIWQGYSGNGGIKGVVNSILGGVESFFNFFVNGINSLIGQLNGLSFGIPDWIRSALGYAGYDIPANVSLNIPTISAFSLPRLADGGIIDTGQIFIARESGAEMVGRYNGSTAVMNNDQIVEAVVRGVYTAVTSAMQNNGITGGGSNEVKVYLDGRQILARTEDIKREKGHTMFSGAYNP